MKKPEIVLATYDEFMGDWQAVYIDGELVDQQDCFTIDEFVTILKNHVGLNFSYRHGRVLNGDDHEESPRSLDDLKLGAP